MISHSSCWFSSSLLFHHGAKHFSIWIKVHTNFLLPETKQSFADTWLQLETLDCPATESKCICRHLEVLRHVLRLSSLYIIQPWVWSTSNKNSSATLQQLEVQDHPATATHTNIKQTQNTLQDITAEETCSYYRGPRLMQISLVRILLPRFFKTYAPGYFCVWLCVANLTLGRFGPHLGGSSSSYGVQGGLSFRVGAKGR